jgi:NTE family protein
MLSHAAGTLYCAAIRHHLTPFVPGRETVGPSPTLLSFLSSYLQLRWRNMVDNRRLTAFVFSGGLGLGAYHAGAFEGFVSRSIPIDWVTGSSAGAISAAIVAGSDASNRIRNLREFWLVPDRLTVRTSARHAFAWMNAVNVRLLGHKGFFRPRFSIPSSRFVSLYDLQPVEERLRKLIDFERLNSGYPRLTICATDLKSGDALLFDSSSERIEMDHILASCGLLPEFPPVQVGNRLLGDGGLSLNAPFDPVLEVPDALQLYIIDLFARDGKLPDGFEAASERKIDLNFGNQTFQRLRHALRARQLRNQLQGLADPDLIYLLSYRPGSEEAGPEKLFELSERAMDQRWQAGYFDMQDAPGAHPDINGVRSVRRRRDDS